MPNRLARLEALAEQTADSLERIEAQLHGAALQAELAQQLAAQTAAQTLLLEQLRDQLLDPATAAESGVAAAGPTSELTRLRTELAVNERRLQLLIEQFAAAQQLREQAVAQASAARGQVAELNARLQQQQLELQEARLRADKAERLHAGLEEAHARAQTQTERLSAELATARERQAEALKQAVALDARLATATARVAQLEAKAGARLAQNASGGPDPDRPTADPAPDLAPDAARSPPQLTTLEAATPPAADNGDRSAGTGLAPSPGASPVIYVVRPGDSLSRISAQVYGDASAWPRIFAANRDVLPAPDRLSPGMSLVIP
ncbi:MAG: LysM peptidoglycan-binding domain-containing protein [Chromatiaceae bacterium]|nr:MAG: LysM peptidoglycan-binding domain-containing protein [Chromatiaceae bacterium]